MFDWTINLSNMLQLGAILGGWLWMFMSMRADIKLIKNDVRMIDKSQAALSIAFTQLGNILTQVAVQDNRIHMLEKNIDELRHGQGYVKNQ